MPLYNNARTVRRALDSLLAQSCTRFRIVISDDGPGFAPDIMKRIGEPYLSRRRGSDEAPSEHGGLGLGVFIARTLLERTGAKVSFTNRHFPDHGAVVQIAWPRRRFEVEQSADETAS